MREKFLLRAAACPLIALLLLGCDDAKMCQPCSKPEEPPQTAIEHNTFNFRFAPPWFNADQRSLFTSYVVFSKEAKFEAWNEDHYESCNGDDASAAVCPEHGFYKQAMTPFLTGLAQCATKGKKVKLRMVGFASSSGVHNLSPKNATKLNDRHAKHIRAISKSCQGEPEPDDSRSLRDSDKLNLIIANMRAARTGEMLRTLATELGLDAFDIKDKPWCSHDSMADEQKHDDGGRGGYDSGKGLMNRRVEVRLVDLPGCLNVDPDNRIDVTNGSGAGGTGLSSLR